MVVPTVLAITARRRTDPAPPPESAVEALLRGTRADELTPREALELVYQLKELLQD